jgi:hypothetical protein
MSKTKMERKSGVASSELYNVTSCLDDFLKERKDLVRDYRLRNVKFYIGVWDKDLAKKDLSKDIGENFHSYFLNPISDCFPENDIPLLNKIWEKDLIPIVIGTLEKHHFYCVLKLTVLSSYSFDNVIPLLVEGDNIPSVQSLIDIAYFSSANKR